MISITSDNNILVQPGTYTATGTTMNWETGEEYTPSYTLDTAKTFYNHSTAPAEADAFYSFSNEKSEQLTATSTGCTWQSNGTVLRDGTTNKDGAWNTFKYSKIAATNLAVGDIITINMDSITLSGLPEEGAPCTLSAALKWNVYTVGVDIEAKLLDSSGNQLGTYSYSYNKSNANTGISFYTAFGRVQLHNNENYTIQIVMTITKAPNNNVEITLNGATSEYYTYPAYSCKVGMEHRRERWNLREDHDNIWNLGYINFNEGSKEIPNSWSETPLYNTNL